MAALWGSFSMQWLVPSKSAPRKENMNQYQGQGHPKLKDLHEDRWLTCWVQSDKTPTVGQIAKNKNSAYDIKVTDHSVWDCVAADQ